MHRAKVFLTVCAGLLCLALAFHIGARSATAQSPAAGEVAVSMGSVPARGFIPLPVYQDGSRALLSECQWIVSPGYVNMSRFDPVLRCETLSGVVPGDLMLYHLTPEDPLDPPRANYLVIAVRSAGPTPAQRETFGGVKSRYRGERGVAPTPTQGR